MQTMGTAYREIKGRSKYYAVIAFAFLIEIGVCLWTFSHNAPLLMSGTDADFRVIGFFAAALGEVFVMFTLGMMFFTGGAQRSAVFASHVAMLVVLLANTIVRYAQLTNAAQASSSLFDIYGTFIAPVIIAVVAVAGALWIVHSDPSIRARDAKLKEESIQRDIQIATLEAVNTQMETALDSPEYTALLQEGTRRRVSKVVREALGLPVLIGQDEDELDDEMPLSNAAPRVVYVPASEHVPVSANGNGNKPRGRKDSSGENFTK